MGAGLDVLKLSEVKWQAKDSLEANELVAAVAEHPGDHRIAEGREFDLQRRAAQPPARR